MSCVDFFFYSMFTFIGGMFMATGGTDHMVRVYYLGADTPMKVSEMDAHTVKEPLVRILFVSLCEIFHFCSGR